MTALAVVLAAVLAVAIVVLVGLPFLRAPQVADDRLDAPSDEEEHRLDLLAERDRALAALREFEFDHRTGKLTDEDYRETLPELRQAAGAALRALDDSASSAREGEGMQPEPAIVPEPTPPPDEGTLPGPAVVPEAYPPPDEATPPQPVTPGQE